MTGENQILEAQLPKLHQYPPVVVGPGDDCAVLDLLDSGKQQLIAVDQVILDVHFRLETDPRRVAAKLVRRNLSDIAAMGGMPQIAVKTIAIKLGSPQAEQQWLDAFFDGLATESDRWRLPLCGGDLSVLPQYGIITTLTITGSVPQGKAILRSGGQAGDWIGVTGCFGNSYLSGHHLDFLPRLEAGRFLAETRVSAMMDVSDGLLMDLGRLCRSSQCGAVLNTDSIPLRSGADLPAALNDGEDYELLFTLSDTARQKLEKSAPELFPDLPFTFIGRLNDSHFLCDQMGHLLCPKGWDPFLG